MQTPPKYTKINFKTDGSKMYHFYTLNDSLTLTTMYFCNANNRFRVNLSKRSMQ